MAKNQFPRIRPLTTKMKTLLKESHERELLQQPPYSIYYTQSAKGLVTRGLFYAKQYTEGIRSYMGFYVTPLGLEYLEQMEMASEK